ncbi:hypothetical protein LPJ59_003589 [Coemansia sp. RSA 2399]|nr:hypothetical protein LPJ59_003589 [Coemansia sp. RSA 2399]KAJ1903139.1 hypothetical protein LPJ81_003217 [Coemansia sp. IMI 209127]
MNVGGSSSQSQPPTNTVQSLIARLVSFFDLSHVSSDTTSTPVTFDMVYDPATGKFTHLTTDVEQSGGAYYVPVCPVDVITGAASAQGCDYGIRLNPVPLNVAQAHLSTVHTLFSIVRNLARPSFMFGGLNAMDYAQ